MRVVAWKTFSVRWPRLSPKKRMSWRSRWIIHDVCAKKKNLCGPFIISYCAVHCEQLRFVIFSFKLYISKIIINTGSARVLFFSLYDPQINGYDFTWTPHVVRTYLTNHFDSLGGEEELSFFSAMSPPAPACALLFTDFSFGHTRKFTSTLGSVFSASTHHECSTPIPVCFLNTNTHAFFFPGGFSTVISDGFANKTIVELNSCDFYSARYTETKLIFSHEI